MDNIIPHDTPQKQCDACLNTFPATTQYFGVYKRAKDGLRNLCKKCRNARDKESRKQNFEVRLEYERAYRQSHREDFRRNNRKYEAKTKGRRSEYFREYRRAHPEVSRRASRKHYYSHHESCLVYLAMYRSGHREEMRTLDRLWRINNPEKAKQASREYHRKNPLRRRVWEARRRARKVANGGVYTTQDILGMYTRQHGLCRYCKNPLRKFHVDHVLPLSRGGSNDPSNLVLACPHCNSSKGSKLVEDWLKWKNA